MTAIFVAGTGTDVGKTWVLTRLITELGARGHDVHARKPAQSFDADERGGTDADLLGHVTNESPTVVCPVHRWYETPMAPPMAADLLGRAPFTIADLADETEVSGVTFVEGAGGPRSPLAGDGDNIDFARAIGAQLVILVADAGLGTINAVALSSAALSGFETIVVLNRFDGTDLHERNRAWLTGAGHLVVTTIDQLAERLETRLPSL